VPEIIVLSHPRPQVFLLPALLGGAILLIAGMGVQASPLFPWLEGNVVSPPFASWDDEADQLFLAEKGRSPYAAEIHYDLGLYFYEQGLYDLSLMHYRKATEIDPGFSEAHFGIGLLFYSLGDDENAIRHYLRSLECNPRDPDTHNNLGLIYYRRGELTEAEKEIGIALQLQPGFADAAYNLGLVRYQQNDLNAAVTCFLQAISQNPEFYRARFNLGVAYFELGLLQLAEEQWQKVVKSAPGTTVAAQAQENLGVLHAQSPK
jgi:tetratricopeptide (TPR) repeat protein